MENKENDYGFVIFNENEKVYIKDYLRYESPDDIGVQITSIDSGNGYLLSLGDKQLNGKDDVNIKIINEKVLIALTSTLMLYWFGRGNNPSEILHHPVNQDAEWSYSDNLNIPRNDK